MVKNSVEEYYNNSDYDTTSSGTNESEVFEQISVPKTSSPGNENGKFSKILKEKLASASTRKKFFRCFSTVEENEEVLKRFSCAFISDILLQGYLFVTTNYFAFYSNVFGYVTRILIPILSVEKITKEKTAKIIPNAVGISTCETKYMFGSLMSRDNTLEYLIKYWEKVKSEAANMESQAEEEGLESSDPERYESAADAPQAKEILIREVHTENLTSEERKKKKRKFLFEAINTIPKIKKMSHPSFLLIATTFLLVLLYISASILLYRINRIQSRYSLNLHDLELSDSNTIYTDLLRWQAELHSKSDAAVYSFLDSNLDQIAKVKQSLETLSSLLPKKTDAAEDETIRNPPETEEDVR